MSYLPSFMPLMGANGATGPLPQTYYPTIEFVAVVDVRASEQEDGSELMVLSFAGDDPLVYDTKKQVLIVSLISGVCALSNEFSDSAGNANPTVISGGHTSTIVYAIEENFQIMCSVRQDPVDSSPGKSSLVVHQVTRLIEGALRLFKMNNTPMEHFVEEYSRSVVRQLLSEFWSGFIRNYNLRLLSNSLGYRGFLGLLPSCDSYRKASLPFKIEGNNALDQLTDQAPKTLCGLVIANFAKSLAKQYGMVGFVEGLGTNSVSAKSMIDVYNWLEYLDCGCKLDIASLTNVSNEQIFNRSEDSNMDALLPPSPLTPPPVPSSISAPYRYQDYITRPINSTILTVFDGLGEVVRSGESVWSSIPGMPGMLRMFNESEPVPENVVEPESESEPVTVGIPPITGDQDGEGHYLLGLNGTGTDAVIYRRMIYLNNQAGEGLRYHLVVYCYDGIHIMMMFDESEDSLGNHTTYVNLKLFGLDQVSKQVQASRSGSASGTELSMHSLDDYFPTVTGDGNFFYIVYDTIECSFASSLPYLRWDRASMPQVTILHDQLSLLFALPQYCGFYENAHMDEFFHKFTLPESSNWLFYFIKHKNQQIIIIEKQRLGKGKAPVPAPAQVQALNVTGSLISALTVAAPQGFLENLGGDVRQWLDSIMSTSASSPLPATQNGG